MVGARLHGLGDVAWEKELGDLGELPGWALGVEDPDQVEAVAVPLLGEGFFVAQEEVGDLDYGAVFPADEDYAGLGLGEFCQGRFLAFCIAEDWFFV